MFRRITHHHDRSTPYTPVFCCSFRNHVAFSCSFQCAPWHFLVCSVSVLLSVCPWFRGRVLVRAFLSVVVLGSVLSSVDLGLCMSFGLVGTLCLFVLDTIAERALIRSLTSPEYASVSWFILDVSIVMITGLGRHCLPVDRIDWGPRG
ncbi:hypothetical protein CPB85DRAFT_975406 [Mucidula mucida]|nr:hypothetical protein CPB85DRAFT_975406 [Mucidula mucida]